MSGRTPQRRHSLPPAPAQVLRRSEGGSVEIAGIGGSTGFAIGPALVIEPGKVGVAHNRLRPSEIEAEIARYKRAVQLANQELQQAIERVRAERGGGAEASILEAYGLMMCDPVLDAEVSRRIECELQGAEWALESAADSISAQLSAMTDDYLAERSQDVDYVRDRILRALTGHERNFMVPSGEPVVIVARDLSPADTATLTREVCLGIVTEVGTRTSHTAILARALEIPAVVGASGAVSEIANGDLVVVDGVHGRVTVAPSMAELELLQPAAERYYALARGRQELRDAPACTADGTLVNIQANIELAVEAEIALSHGARGIGLYRTEFLYIDRQEPPDEDEQYEAYRKVVSAMAPLPVTLRTFDIGGDKFVSAIRMPKDMNPALGLRAVRLGLERPELLKTQLRAMVRASAYGMIRIMLPMVASLSELRQVRAMLSECIYEVSRAGHAHADHIPLGCMVEVPSTAILAEEFARESEFFSIGTNDLVQYTLAVDRTSRELARLASYFDPAVVRLIRGVIRAGEAKKRSVSVCGAMASDPLAALFLVGMGLRNLSMEASAIPEVKLALSRIRLDEAEEAAQIAFEATTAQELEQSLALRFAPLLADLLDPA